MTTITNTSTRIVRYHDEAMPQILEVIDFQTVDAQTKFNVARIGMTPMEWKALKEIL